MTTRNENKQTCQNPIHVAVLQICDHSTDDVKIYKTFVFAKDEEAFEDYVNYLEANNISVVCYIHNSMITDQSVVDVILDTYLDVSDIATF